MGNRETVSQEETPVVDDGTRIDVEEVSNSVPMRWHALRLFEVAGYDTDASVPSETP
jgi:hypothetical protein